MRDSLENFVECVIGGLGFSVCIVLGACALKIAGWILG
jgi:hypothetical protein